MMAMLKISQDFRENAEVSCGQLSITMPMYEDFILQLHSGKRKWPVFPKYIIFLRLTKEERPVTEL